MDSASASSNRGRVNLESSRSRRVRIVGRVRDFTDQESESSTQSWINVCKSGGGDSSESGVKLLCSDQSSRKQGVYRLDYCYEQDEGISTIFSKEIKPLISDVLDGGNATVIAYGAKGSGKTYTIQGTEAKPGLAVMSMNELLTKATETGQGVSVSILEVYQEHVYDLLDPKYTEIQILGDGQGKINLKGLTQVPVKCVSEFENMYFNKGNVCKSLEKIPIEQPKRSHRCLMIHVSKVDDSLNLKHEGKMLFIDLAGYEGARRCSGGGNEHVETSRTNMSLQAVMNVVYALNANEIHVPYRESKLTRIFQEFVGGINHVLLLTCLNTQLCLDTIHTLSLSSRACQSMNNLLANSEGGDKSSTRSKRFPSQKLITPSTPTTLKNASTKINPSTTPRTLQKQIPSTTPRTLKKEVHSTTPRTFKKQALSVNASTKINPFTTPRTLQKQIPSTTPRTLKKEVHSTTPRTFKKQALSVNVSAKKTNQIKAQQGGDYSVKKFDLKKEDRVDMTTIPLMKALQDEKPTFDHALSLAPEGVVSVDDLISETSLDLVTVKDECASMVPEDVGNILSESSLGEDKKDDNKGNTPPLSVRLQELANSMRTLCTSTPLSVKAPEDFNKQPSSQVGYVADFIEPKTPEFSTKLAPMLDRTNYASPWDRLNARSSGMKDSLAQEYLKFLNTAGKEELKGLKGIGEKRATYILELRDESPEPFKDLDDLQNIGLSTKQAKVMMKKLAADLLS